MKRFFLIMSALLGTAVVSLGLLGIHAAEAMTGPCHC